MKNIICKLKGHKFMYVKWHEHVDKFPHLEYLCIRCGGLIGDQEYAINKGKVLNVKAKDRDKVEDDARIEDTYIL